MSTHVFESAGLGKAPFRYVGLNEAVTSTGRPGGSCDYCGTAIQYCCEIESADGKAFVVGCECVKKTGDKGLDKAIKAAKKEAILGKKLARVAAAKAIYADVAHVLDCQKHPNKYFASQGKTMADWVVWILENGGIAAKIDAAKEIEGAKMIADDMLAHSYGFDCIEAMENP